MYREILANWNVTGSNNRNIKTDLCSFSLFSVVTELMGHHLQLSHGLYKFESSFHVAVFCFRMFYSFFDCIYTIIAL